MFEGTFFITMFSYFFIHIKYNELFDDHCYAENDVKKINNVQICSDVSYTVRGVAAILYKTMHYYFGPAKNIFSIIFLFVRPFGSLRQFFCSLYKT